MVKTSSTLKWLCSLNGRALATTSNTLKNRFQQVLTTFVYIHMIIVALRDLSVHCNALKLTRQSKMADFTPAL